MLRRHLGRDYAAVSAPWDILPRTALDSHEAADAEQIERLLEERGLPPKYANVGILQNYSVDLDGDGNTEQLIYAETQPAYADVSQYRQPQDPKGRFAMLLLRRYVHPYMQDTVLLSDVRSEAADGADWWRPYPQTYGIVAVADLNGDGKMEVIAKIVYRIGVEYVVYEMTETGVQEVLRNGWVRSS